MALSLLTIASLAVVTTAWPFSAGEQVARTNSLTGSKSVLEDHVRVSHSKEALEGEDLPTATSSYDGVYVASAEPLDNQASRSCEAELFEPSSDAHGRSSAERRGRLKDADRNRTSPLGEVHLGDKTYRVQSGQTSESEHHQEGVSVMRVGNGKVRVESRRSFVNDEMIEVRTTWHGNQKFAVERFKSGVRDGESLLWSLDSGVLLHSINYTDGKWNGLCRYWYESGSLMKEANWKMGFLSGHCSDYYENGSLKRSGEYDNGFRVGTWIRYHENGVVAWCGSYREAHAGPVYGLSDEYDEDTERRVGEWLFFDDHGSLIESYYYER